MLPICATATNTSTSESRQVGAVAIQRTIAAIALRIPILTEFIYRPVLFIYVNIRCIEQLEPPSYFDIGNATRDAHNLPARNRVAEYTVLKPMS